MSEMLSQLIGRFENRVIDWWDYVNGERSFYPREPEYTRKKKEARDAIYNAFSELEKEKAALQRRVEELENYIDECSARSQEPPHEARG